MDDFKQINFEPVDLDNEYLKLLQMISKRHDKTDLQIRWSGDNCSLIGKKDDLKKMFINMVVERVLESWLNGEPKAGTPKGILSTEKEADKHGDL